MRGGGAGESWKRCRVRWQALRRSCFCSSVQELRKEVGAHRNDKHEQEKQNDLSTSKLQPTARTSAKSWIRTCDVCSPAGSSISSFSFVSVAVRLLCSNPLRICLARAFDAPALAVLELPFRAILTSSSVVLAYSWAQRSTSERHIVPWCNCCRRPQAVETVLAEASPPASEC